MDNLPEMSERLYRSVTHATGVVKRTALHERGECCCAENPRMAICEKYVSEDAMSEVLHAGLIALAITLAAVAIVTVGAWVIMKIYDKTEDDNYDF